LEFTEARVKSYEPPDGKLNYSLWDDNLPGFGFRVQNGGSKVYYAKYRIGSLHRWLKIGRVDKLSLADATKTARGFFKAVADNVDPANTKAKAVAALATTFGASIPDYLAQLETDNNSAQHVKRCKAYLARSFAGLHTMSFSVIDRATVTREVRSIGKRGPVVANRARACLSAYFNWAISSGLCETNPVDKSVKNKERHRTRALTPAELKAVWHHVDDAADENDEYSDIVKLLILTCARRTMISELERTEINWTEKQIELSPERTKNGLPLIIPLSPPALAILRSVAARTNGKILFAKRNNWQWDKDRLDKKLGDMPHWVLHDFRRTGKTNMAKLFRVPPHVSEAILGHKPKGLEAVYNEHDYLDEKREALDKYAAWIMKIVA
jgi:integrase